MKKALLLLLLLAAALAAFLYYQAVSRSSARPTDGRAIPVPEFLRDEDPGRLFCAESADTGVCRCITAAGQRPEISQAECRRRARESQAN